MKQQFLGFWYLCRDTIVVPLLKSALYYFFALFLIGFAVFMFLLIWGTATTEFIRVISHIH
ncbi:hypothetical protein [Dictyobacter kobayashii]|uniref:Uncharacterized protein n=1 Tax=Dictyobacter kobayashii TaxID=2014872 RepID=A0A402AXV9_9CHLR|nr:hypothetical protein [Dictyobacter kobayashii]GCE23909.1 hypothetical protein KDK_77090 [Dictyobacter kobayashii]